MCDVPARIALLGLFGLALVTASTNVESIQRSYRLAEMEREEQDLRLMITHRDDLCRRMLRTEELAALGKDLGFDNGELFPTRFDGDRRQPPQPMAAVSAPPAERSAPPGWELP